jgi:hypothetical protein
MHEETKSIKDLSLIEIKQIYGFYKDEEEKLIKKLGIIRDKLDEFENEISYRKQISSNEAKEKVEIKRQLRERKIIFDNDETLDELKERLIAINYMNYLLYK